MFNRGHAFDFISVLRRLRAQLSQTMGAGVGSATIHRHIAEAVGVSQADVAVMDARISGSDLSLNAPSHEGDGGSSAERLDHLADVAPLPDEVVGEAIDTDRRVVWLRKALDVLSERELGIIRERRLSDEAATLEATCSKVTRGVAAGMRP